MPFGPNGTSAQVAAPKAKELMLAHAERDNAGQTQARPPTLPLQAQSARTASLFISDLHLAPERPGTIALFLDFLNSRARGAARLFILGDLFDAWIGDDDDTPTHRAVIESLRRLSDSGTVCALMRGNRDFLLGRRFARAAGCTLLRDPTCIELDGERLLLMHGDLLCTDDLAYQRFRRRVRNPLVQRLFLWKSLAERRRIAADYRQKSSAANMAKTEDIMDVNPGEVVRRMQRADVRRLVHGHTHRAADHELQVNRGSAMRHVLSEWHDDHGEVLVHHPGSWSRLTID